MMTLLMGAEFLFYDYDDDYDDVDDDTCSLISDPCPAGGGADGCSHCRQLAGGGGGAQ